MFQFHMEPLNFRGWWYWCAGKPHPPGLRQQKINNTGLSQQIVSIRRPPDYWSMMPSLIEKSISVWFSSGIDTDENHSVWNCIQERIITVNNVIDTVKLFFQVMSNALFTLGFGWKPCSMQNINSTIFQPFYRKNKPVFFVIWPFTCPIYFTPHFLGLYLLHFSPLMKTPNYWSFSNPELGFN